MNHYQTLGLDRDASKADIKKAYRKLASKHHPDKGGDAEEFKRIQNAYDILSNDQRRAEYDLSGARRRTKDFWGGYDPDSYDDYDPWYEDDKYADFVRKHRERSSYWNHRTNPDLNTTVTIDLAQAYRGDTVMIDVHGRRHSLKIPPGTKTGNKYRISGAGTSRYTEAKPGDLIVSVMVRHSNAITVEDQDITMRVEINALEAMTGTNRVIEHVSGKHINVKIPAGTQNGKRMRLSNMGMPFKTNPKVFGDMFVQVTVTIPTITDPAHLEWIKTINQEVNS